MVSEEEEAGIRSFVFGELRDEPDLSTLTLGILKKRYLAHVRCESLSPEAKSIMKRVVEEELMKMQDNDGTGSESETTKPRNKRKREKENDEVISGRDDDDESTAKKSRHLSSSSSESEDKDDRKTGSEQSEEEEQIKSESEDAEEEVNKSQRKTNGKQPINGDGSTDEEMNKSVKKGDESDCDESPEKTVIKKKSTSRGKKTPASDEEDETDSDSKSEKSDKINGNDSSDDGEKEEKVSVEKENEDPDSDSSSLPSLEDEQKSVKEKARDDKEKKTRKKEKSAKGPKDYDKSVVRLKRYLFLCGVRPNYKKLLDGCRSVRSMVAVLKKQLEDLGVHGQPSIKKCRKARENREETQELAGLDISNIIATTGRPKRTSAWQKRPDPPSSTYLRSLNSGSDSDVENDAHRGRRRANHWANLQGVISDDADSD
ncbi:HIRA-interacting protein 3 [Sebastes fasciatus]|uniref:HIRA-interacting protein 3 n=1 Tax=Sebastes fasciatus TaxID=394691 RepID=UPI003D9E51F2